MPAGLIIFDCDGVLVDSEPLGNRVLAETAADSGVCFSLEEAMGCFRGHSLDYCVGVIESRLGRAVEPSFVETYRRRLYETFENELQSVPGVAEVVAALPTPFCVASSGPQQKIRLALEVTGLLRWFDGRIFSAYDRRRWKPDPDLFLHAAATLGAAPSECIVVEDSIPGVQAGLAAGMRVLAFNADGRDDELTDLSVEMFRDMAQLPALLRA